MLKCSLIALIIGVLFDFIMGDPNFALHPIRLIGNLIAKLEIAARKMCTGDRGLKIAGFFIVIFVLLFVLIISSVVIFVTYHINKYFGIAVEAVICYFMLAAKSLKTESTKVYNKLIKNDIEGAREAVAMIVGRDTQNLDKEGITKAAVETVAENLSDGVIAPLIYMLLGGGVLGVMYKAINTMDSMIGYKDEKYINLGFCAAKLDDIVNFIPARIAAFAMIAAAFVLKKDYKNAVKIYKRDRFNHTSPNSAQTEAVCAGALRIRLAGDAYYFGKLYKKPFIGDAIDNITPQKINEANSLMYAAAIITIIFLGGIRLLICFGGLI